MVRCTGRRGPGVNSQDSNMEVQTICNSTFWGFNAAFWPHRASGTHIQLWMQAKHSHLRSKNVKSLEREMGLGRREIVGLVCGF